MARDNIILTNFTAGELSPRLEGRTDISKYANGCRILENCITMPHGGATKRPGTIFINGVKIPAKTTVLIPFEFSTLQAYMMELGDKYIRFYMDQGLIVTAYTAWVTATPYAPGNLVTAGGNYYRCLITHTSGVFATDLAAAKWVLSGGVTDLAYEIPTPYVADETPYLRYAQSADVMYLTHPDYPTMKLSRADHDDWTLEEVSFESKRELIITNITKAVAGVVTSAGHNLSNGEVVRITGVVGMIELNGTYQTVAGKTDTTFTIADTSAMTPYVSGGTAVKAITGITAANPGVVTMAAHGFENGDVVEISGVSGMVELNGTLQVVAGVTTDTFTIGNTSAMTAYTSGGVVVKRVFAVSSKYPSCVTFFEERLALASSWDKPQTVFASVSGDYENFTLGPNADDAIEYTIAADKVNSILWLCPQDFLILGTVGGVWRMGGATAGDPITPDSILAKRHIALGSADIQGIIANDLLLYVQRAGRKVREVSYDYRKDGYIGEDITILSEHITRGPTPNTSGISSMVYQMEPDSIVWCVRKDGQLIGMTYEKTQDVIGWHRHVTQGSFESIAIIPGTNEDEVWAIVKRTVGGNPVRYVECFVPRDYGPDKKDAFFVDCGLTWDGGDPVAISGATKANPVVVTATSHGFSNGDKVRITGVGGMTQLNEHVYTVANKAAHTFELSGIGGTGYSTYTSGGYAQKVAQVIDGYDHLQGKVVSIAAEGGALPNQTVTADGKVDLGAYYNTVHVGLGYSSTIKPMKLEMGATLSSSQGQIKKIDHITVRVHETIGCKIGDKADRLDNVLFGLSPDPFTGDKRLPFPGGHDRGGNILLVSDQPLPFTILAILVEGTTFERNVYV